MSAYLQALLEELYDFESLFLSPDDLEMLDVQASQVSLTSENELSFNPCFFRPQPDGLLEKYPLDEEEEWEPSEHFPSFQEIMDRDPSNPINELIAKLETGQTLECFDWMQFDSDETREILEDLDPVQHTLGIADNIEYILRKVRKGSDGKTFRLPELLQHAEEPFDPRRKGNDPIKHVVQFPRVYWTLHSTLQYIGRPHSYMSCLSLVFMTDVNRGLTRDELTAIVSMMLIRLNHEPFRKCKVHPVLVFAFFGGQMGRIIQASYDGQDLVLQYSPLWKIEGNESPVMELFVRYRLSELVDGICSIPIR